LREPDARFDTPLEPALRFERRQLLTPGQIVPVAIELRPMAWRFHAGEQLRVVIAGHDLDPTGLPGVPAVTAANRGVHIIHTGGQHASRLILLQSADKAHP
jgi:predicted acyl esterase